MQLRRSNGFSGYHGSSVDEGEAVEVAELRYFAIDDIPDNLSPPNVPAMRAYIKKKG